MAEVRREGLGKNTPGGEHLTSCPQQFGSDSMSIWTKEAPMHKPQSVESDISFVVILVDICISVYVYVYIYIRIHIYIYIDSGIISLYTFLYRKI